MKTYIRNLFLLPALIAGLGWISAGRVTAQTFTNLHSFTAISGPSNTNSDGAYPSGGLILSGNTLYGTTFQGGSSGNGTVFAMNTNGTGFTNLHSFTGSPSEGSNPQARLILSGDTLYGTTRDGGSSFAGTVFKLSTNGTGFVTLHTFNGTSDGLNPYAELILSGNTLYGTAYYGGNYPGDGTVFAVNTDGTGFTTLYSFTATSYSYPPTNSDGAHPFAGLILSGSTLYGTAEAGGSLGVGTVFALNTNGTGFTNLHNFTGSEGATPHAGLMLSGNTLYGITAIGGTSGVGTLFAVNTDGTGFTNLHSLNDPSDGRYSYAGLIANSLGNTLYGTTFQGGSVGLGTVFAVRTNGTGFTNLHSFAGYPSDGGSPQAGLILSGNTLYGTASRAGSFDSGTVFSLSLPVPPQLGIIRSGAKVILTWPTNATGFALQAAPSLLSGTFTNVPGATSPYTNAATGSQMFFRLKAN